jgi:hypothetical protein
MPIMQLRCTPVQTKNEPRGSFLYWNDAFWQKFQRNLSEISLQLLKLLSIKKRDILEKSRKNKIFIISGFNVGHRNDKKSPG